MSTGIINEFKRALDTDPVFSVKAAISPLFLIFTWQDDKNKNPLHILGLSKGRESYILINERKYTDIAIDRFRQYFNDEVSLDELHREYYSYEKDTQVLYNELSEIKLKDVSNEDLFLYLEKLKPLAKQLADITIYVESVDYEKTLSVVGVENEAMLKAIWEQATEAAFISFEQRRNKIILDSIDSSNAVKKTKFIFTDYFWTKDEVDIEKILSDFKDTYKEKEDEYSKFKLISENKLEQYNNWAENLDSMSAKVSNFLQWVMHMRDIRKDPIAQLQTMLADLSTEVMKRVGLDEKYAPSVIYYEYLQGLEYIVSIKEDIKRRIDGCLYLAYPDYSFKTEVCDFESASKELELYIKEKSGHVEDLKGQVACKGNVKGVVRVVFDPQDDKGFQDGDILVTSMTRPEFVPLMKRAGAVVTNEGGITCHAAIVSRELKIPCVIGTKFATQILSDGDMVEVDADKGIIKKIN